MEIKVGSKWVEGETEVTVSRVSPKSVWYDFVWAHTGAKRTTSLLRSQFLDRHSPKPL